MGKFSKRYSFKNGEISKDESGRYILTEVNKDDCEMFDLTSLIDEMIGITGITLSFGSEDIVPSID